jgi:hypothetical protein
LPFGRGKQFLNNNALLDAAIGGWQISGTIVESSGNPFSITAPGPLYSSTTATQFADRVPGVSTTPQGGRGWQHWYNPAAFSNPGPGNFGNVQRNPLVGPGINVVNLSGGKTFSITEAVKLQIRCDATNAFNHASFGPPTNNQTNLTGANPGAPFTAPVGSISSVTVGGRSLQLSARVAF